VLRFTVDARPVPQGSMTASYNRRTGTAHVHHVQGGALAMWRASVRMAAKDAGAELISAPVSVSIVFGMVRPKVQTYHQFAKRIVRPKFEHTRPAVAPDLDKLIRGVLDALTGICYNDDSQVVDILASKIYADVTVIGVARAKEVSVWMGTQEETDTSTGQLHLPLL
jgi:crossover junction endodeoxyribonuclease RusA